MDLRTDKIMSSGAIIAAMIEDMSFIHRSERHLRT